MTVNITPEQVKFLTQSGITQEQVKTDIDNFRSKGLSDDEIQNNFNSHIENISNKYQDIQNQYDAGKTVKDLLNMGYTENDLANQVKYSSQPSTDAANKQIEINKQYIPKDFTPTNENPVLQANISKTGFPAIGQDVKSGVFSTGSKLLDFLKTAYNDVKTTGYNIGTHNPFESLGAIGNVAGHDVINTPIDIINGITGIPSAISASYTHTPYVNPVTIPNSEHWTDFLPNNNKRVQELEQQRKMYPTASLLGQITALNPLFKGSGIIKNILLGTGIGALGTNTDLSNRMGNAGVGAIVSSVPPLVHMGISKTLKGTGVLAGVHPKSTETLIEMAKKNPGSVYKKVNDTDFANLSDQIGQEIQNQAPTVNEITSPDIYNKQYQNLGQDIEKAYKNYFPDDKIYSQKYADIAKKVNEGIKHLKEENGNSIRTEAESLKNLDSIPYKDIKDIIENTVNDFSLGDTSFNPAEKVAALNTVYGWLKDAAGITKESEEIKNESKSTGLLPEQIKYKNTAYDILANALGKNSLKNSQWLKSRLESDSQKPSTQLQRSNIEDLLRKSEDNIETILPEWKQYFGDTDLSEENAGIAYALKAFDAIQNKDWKNFGEDSVLKKYYEHLGQGQELPDNLVNPLSLHHIKHLIQGMTNYNTENYGIKNHVYKNIANVLNEKLRNLSPSYADVNQRFSDMQDILNNLPKDKGSLLANYGSKNNILNSNDELINKLDAILPDKYKFVEDLSKTLKNQVDNQEWKNRIPRVIFKDISKYDKLTPKEQEAIEDLDSIMSGTTGKEQILSKYLKLKEQQQQNLISQELKKQSSNNVLKNYLDKFPKGLIEDPQKILEANPIQKRNFEQLNTNAKKPFMQDLKEKSALDEFNHSIGSKEWRTWNNFRNALRVGGGGLLPFIQHNPLYLGADAALELLMSPTFHKTAIAGHGLTSKYPAVVNQGIAYQSYQKKPNRIKEYLRSK